MIRRGAHRIVVGLQSVEALDETIEAAAVLASTVQGEILGLFVVEQALLDAAGLPLTVITATRRHVEQRLTAKMVRDAMDRAERTCRASLDAIARRAGVNWSIERHQGDFTTALLDSTTAGDFVVVPAWSGLSSRSQQVSNIRQVAQNAFGVMIVHTSRLPVARHAPVVAIDDGDQTGAETISVAVQLAKVTGRRLNVLALATTPAGAEAIKARARAIAGPRQALSISQLVHPGQDAIAARLAALSPCFVVGDIQGEPFRDDPAVIKLQRAAGAPVLLLHGTNQPGSSRQTG